MNHKNRDKKTYIQSFKFSTDCIPGRHSRRPVFGLHVEREPLWLAS
jgi:hypothetical protein